MTIVHEADERARPTERLESERLFAEALIEAMPGVVYLYNEKGQFLRWNDDFEKVSGYSSTELVTMHPLDFFAGDEKALLSERIAQVFEHGTGQVEANFVSKDGTATPYFFTGKRVEIFGELCLLGVGVDISERRRAERLLEKSEERLNDEFERAYERLHEKSDPYTEAQRLVDALLDMKE